MDPATRYTLLLARSKGLRCAQRAAAAQHQDLAQLEALAQRLGDRQRQAEIALCQALYADHIDEYQETIRYAQRAIELAATIQDVEQEAKGYLHWGRALVNLSDY